MEKKHKKAGSKTAHDMSTLKSARMLPGCVRSNEVTFEALHAIGNPK
jgi:hypothetical protein